jgi:hypothetical protein
MGSRGDEVAEAEQEHVAFGDAADDDIHVSA